MVAKYNVMIDAMVYDYQTIFADFGYITALAGKEINNQTLIDNSTDILIIRSRTKVNKNLLKNTQVKFIGSTVAGLDHIDLDYLADHNITFSWATGANANAVAEYVISALVNLAADKNFDLRQKTLAIIGVGNVGQSLYQKAKNLGLKTLLNDPPRQVAENLSHFVDLKTALKADIISFHTPLTKTGKYPTYQLLNARNFSSIKPNSIIINTARGGIINEKIWQDTKTQANIIDCWENEPNINQTLRKTAYWATPHIAGHSIDAKFLGSYRVYKDLCQFLNIPANTALKNNVVPNDIKINTPKPSSLKVVLNTIYNFKNDCSSTATPTDFNHHRQNYPPRYEWQHYHHPLLQPLR